MPVAKTRSSPKAEQHDERAGRADGGKGVAVCLMYEEGDDVLTFDEEVVYLAEAPNFLAGDEEVPAIIEDEEVDE